MEETKGIGVKKAENFSDWYTEVILKAEMADYSPVSGCMVFLPRSYAMWEFIQEHLNREIKRRGHKNAYFPMFIPERLLTKEAEHFAGFVPEVAWVTHGGETPLEERLAIRPTSETIMYTMFAKWIQSWRDLPLLLNQWCSVVRWETKAVKPFLRTREFLWQEGHTAHATLEEAEKEVREILDVYKEMVETLLAVPVLAGVKSESEKFAGAHKTTTIETIMPDGKALQMGTSHNLGQNFSKAFGITFLGEDNQTHHAWQTSWGVSTRMIGAMVMVHSDDKGLVIPPRVAPEQVVIIPIYYGEKKEVIGKVERVEKLLKDAGIRVFVDNREDKTPGWKYNEWELKGVPLRIEIGPKDVEKGSVVVVRRDNGKKEFVADGEMATKIPGLLEDIQKGLLKKAQELLQRSTTEVHDYESFKKVLEEKKGFLKCSWCESPDCEAKVKNETGATVRLIPFDSKAVGSCAVCGEKAAAVAYFARSY